MVGNTHLKNKAVCDDCQFRPMFMTIGHHTFSRSHNCMLFIRSLLLQLKVVDVYGIERIFCTAFCYSATGIR